MKTTQALTVCIPAAVALLVWTLLSGRGGDVAAQADEVLDGYKISVEIDGVPGTVFRGVEGLLIQTKVIEFRDGADPSVVRKLPGDTSWGDLALKVGPGALANAMWDWYKTVLQSRAAKRNMAVILVDKKGEQVVRYLLANAWPSRWDGPRQVAPNTAIPIEVVTISCERIEREAK